jgi:hypothetical protein
LADNFGLIGDLPSYLISASLKEGRDAVDTAELRAESHWQVDLSGFARYRDEKLLELFEIGLS